MKDQKLDEKSPFWDDLKELGEKHGVSYLIIAQKDKYGAVGLHSVDEQIGMLSLISGGISESPDFKSCVLKALMINHFNLNSQDDEKGTEISDNSSIDELLNNSVKDSQIDEEKESMINSLKEYNKEVDKDIDGIIKDFYN